VLGREDFPYQQDDELPLVPRAEEVLVNVVAGCRQLESARADLHPYVAWIDAHPEIAGDLEKRSPSFIAWLKGSPPAR
jgi:hypothetical protein